MVQSTLVHWYVSDVSCLTMCILGLLFYVPIVCQKKLINGIILLCMWMKVVNDWIVSCDGERQELIEY